MVQNEAMEPAHLCLTRHGETDWNRQGILQGWLDVPLNDSGREQAYAMAAQFAASGFSGVWSSPLVRALETAEIIARELCLPAPQSHAGLKERHFGAIQGIPKRALAELNPVLLQQILRRNPAASFVGGESMDEFADRLLGACTDIGARHPGQRVLAITHGWVLDAMLRHIGNLGRTAVLFEKPKNGESVWARVHHRTITADQA